MTDAENLTESVTHLKIKSASLSMRVNKVSLFILTDKQNVQTSYYSIFCCFVNN